VKERYAECRLSIRRENAQDGYCSAAAEAHADTAACTEAAGATRAVQQFCAADTGVIIREAWRRIGMRLSFNLLNV